MVIDKEEMTRNGTRIIKIMMAMERHSKVTIARARVRTRVNTSRATRAMDMVITTLVIQEGLTVIGTKVLDTRTEFHPMEAAIREDSILTRHTHINIKI